MESIGAKRVMFDTLEALFSGFSNPGILRAEFRRLFRWLKDRGLTTVVTAERGEGTLTRHGLEEYVSDCVILLDHRIKDQISARRMRIVKYRGTKHGADEYPFLIDERGMSILPLTSLQLQHDVSNERRAHRACPILTRCWKGRAIFADRPSCSAARPAAEKPLSPASFADATCRRGERCLFIDFEESPKPGCPQHASVGLDLEQWSDKGLLFHEAWRPTQFGIEMHLLRIHKLIEKVKPQCVILDPITNLISGSTEKEVYSMLMRLIDFLKSAGITGRFRQPHGRRRAWKRPDVGISSLTDTWILLRDLRAQRRTQPLPLRSEVPRHGALQPAARIRDDSATASN